MAKAGLMDRDTQVYLAKKYRTQLCSGFGTFCSVFAGSPMENVKTRMQSVHFKNALEAIKYTHRTEGLRGFWAGTSAPLISITATRVVGFSVYQKAKYALDEVIENATGKSPLKLVNTPGLYPDWHTVTCFTTAGALSGVGLALFGTPFELVKNATQTSVLMASDHVSRGPSIGSVSPEKHGRISSYGVIKQIVKRRGVLGLWTGFNLHLARDVIGSAVYFGVYESVKQGFTAYSGAEKPNAYAAVGIAGFSCGILSWCLTYPLDTKKTRAQNMLVGDAAKFAKRVAAEGAKAAARSSHWKGIEMMILRSSVQNMIQMSIFEWSKGLVNNLEYSDGGKDMKRKWPTTGGPTI